ncbi:MAG: OmcA/MtrC family decaheme c-type cytochrome [Acidobacteria bacterium]|nr:OmcA/MtrC family decaheme c-type cytochrome [Acidobacteriota bacterium]
MRLTSILIRFTLVLTILAGAVLVTSAPGPSFSPREKAYYADPNLVNFVRPGLRVKILTATIDADGTIRARFRISDPRDLGLDRDGVVTPGPVTTSFIASYLPQSGTQEVAYTTRVQTSPITAVSATQAAADTGGRYTKLASDGEYEYVFGVKAPASIDRAATHYIGVYSSRNLSEFDMGINRFDDVYPFVPNGAKVTQVRDVVRDAACNKCHEQLALHGGSRRSVQLCIMCHQPQTSDPDTGNTVDFPVMIHKIHMGAQLPSVQAGKKYIIIGNAQSVNDFSTVEFPADPRTCSACHQPGAAQANNVFKPTRAACGACHDNVNFATGENHIDLPQVSDNQCATCHIQQGELDFDASILGAHMIPRFSRHLPGTVFELVGVDDGSAGKRPTVSFTIKDKSGKPILPSEMTRLALVLSGPTSDYANYVSEDALRAQGSGGAYYWTFADPIPANAKGSFSVGIEGYRNVKVLEGTKKEITVRDAGVNKVIHFSVDGSKLEPRRQIVSVDKCNGCHSSLSLHGDNRNRIEQCVLCHNPNENDRARRPAAENPPQSVDFRSMIHRIHTGEDGTRPLIIYGFGGSKNDFSDVRYPQGRGNCGACHVNGSENLPLRENLLSVNTPRGWFTPMGPATSACLGCHDGRATASHALAQTTILGESCAACHGSNADFSVARVHAQ